MPIYEYRCQCGKLFEVFSKLKDMQQEEKCSCGKRGKKTFAANPIHFKSRGFPGNDSRKRYLGDQVVDNKVEDLFEDHHYDKRVGGRY